MNTYLYKGLSASGIPLSGEVKAYSEFEAVNNLRDKVAVVTKIEEMKDDTSTKNAKIKAKDLALICSQFSIILSSGLPIVKCVEMVASQAGDKNLRRLLEKVAEDVEGGHTLAESFETNGPQLPVTFLETIRGGEQSGTLESCFKRLQRYFENSSKTKSKVKGALTYPAIVLVVAIVVVVIIMVVAVPMFTETFESMGTELPAITKGLIAVSNFCTQGWWVMLIIAALCVIAYKVYDHTEKGHLALANFSISKSPMKKINIMNQSAEFANTMCTMLSAGMSIVRALEITANVASNYAFSLAVKRVRDGVEQGQGIADCMKKETTVFPDMLTEMTGVGEQSGSMESTLTVIAEYYASEVDVATQKLLAMMEPAITIGLAGITCVLLLSVYLPMFSMYSSIS